MAKYVIDAGLCDEMWFVVSPQNPLKPTALLAPDEDRLVMTRMAVRETLPDRNVFVSEIEFDLPKPSYTIDTLRVLEEKIPNCKLSILGGADMIEGIKKWKESDVLLADYDFLIYPRDGHTVDTSVGRITYLKDAPKFQFSSTDVRYALEKGASISGMVAESVEGYLKSHQLWGEPINELQRIEALTEAISNNDKEIEYYLERGRLYYKRGVYDKALNDYIKVNELDPDNIEAKEHIKLLKDIFEYRYMDYYNP